MGGVRVFKESRDTFESLEELYLVQFAEASDIELLRPYLTVYGNNVGNVMTVNINTVHPYILEALIATMPGGEHEKAMLRNKIEMFRGQKKNGTHQVFRQEHLNPEAFLEVLDLPKTIELNSLAIFFVYFVVVDSRVFNVKVISTLPGTVPYHMEAVLGSRFANGLSGQPLEILSWREGINV